MADLELRCGTTTLRVEREPRVTLCWKQGDEHERYMPLTPPQVGQLMAFLGRWEGSADG